MKKINRLVLRNAKTLTFPEMKNISGGYDGEVGIGCLAKCPDGERYKVSDCEAATVRSACGIPEGGSLNEAQCSGERYCIE